MGCALNKLEEHLEMKTNNHHFSADINGIVIRCRCSASVLLDQCTRDMNSMNYFWCFLFYFFLQINMRFGGFVNFQTYRPSYVWMRGNIPINIILHRWLGKFHLFIYLLFFRCWIDNSFVLCLCSRWKSKKSFFLLWSELNYCRNFKCERSNENDFRTIRNSTMDGHWTQN